MRKRVFPVLVIVFFFAIIVVEYVLDYHADEKFDNLLLLPTMYSGLLTFVGVWWSLSENQLALTAQKVEAARPFLQMMFSIPVGMLRISDQVEIGDGDKRDELFVKCATNAPYVWNAYQVNNESILSLSHKITITGEIWNGIWMKRDWIEIRLFGTDCYNKEYTFLITKTGVYLM